MSQYQHDELAQLFARNMNFTQPLPQLPVTPDKQFHTDAQPIVYASTHYTPTHYLRPAESPFRSDSAMGGAVENIESTLIQHSINPASLSPSQIKLYTNADYEQRLRLLELWRISPPENDNIMRQSGDTWSLSSIAQEEEMARIRYEKQIHEREQYEREEQGMGNGREIWNEPKVTSSDAMSSEVEPYIESGYANPQRFDPVYLASVGLWQAPNYNSAAQFGASDQARNFEHLQDLNRQVESQRFTGLHGPLDEDMVM